MEKEQILASLQAELGQTSLSLRTIENYVDNVMPADGTEPDAGDFTRHASILKSLNGQFNHDVAAAVEDYKKKNPIPQTEPETKPDGDSKEMKEILERMKVLEEQNAASAQRLHSEQMKNELLKKSGSLKVNNKNLWEDEVNNLDYSQFKTVDEALAKLKTVYEEKLARYTPSAVPFGQQNGSGGQVSEKELQKRREAYLASLKK